MIGLTATSRITAGMRIHGTLTKWNDERGFGFVTLPQTREEIFVHISAFRETECDPALERRYRLKSAPAPMVGSVPKRYSDRAREGHPPPRAVALQATTSDALVVPCSWSLRCPQSALSATTLMFHIVRLAQCRQSSQRLKLLAIRSHAMDERIAHR